MVRPEITEAAVEYAVKELKQLIEASLEKHGKRTYASRHEVLGIIEEERLELVAAITKGDSTDVKKELLDIAGACVFGVACINARTLDW